MLIPTAEIKTYLVVILLAKILLHTNAPTPTPTENTTKNKLATLSSAPKVSLAKRGI